MMKRDNDALKHIESLLEKLLEELVVEAVDYPDSLVPLPIPIPTRIFLEMEDAVGERINFIGLS